MATDAIDDTRVRSLVGDIADPQVLRGAIDQDTAVIFHLAAVVSGPRVSDEIFGALRGNLTHFAIIKFLSDRFPQEIYNLPPEPELAARARDGA